MRIRLLGPVDVVVDGEARMVSGLRRKAVLATLALHGGEVVSVSRLVDAVWGESAPSTVRNTLQSHVSYLRTLLGDKNVIVGRPPGYRLDVGDDGTGVWLAERLLDPFFAPAAVPLLNDGLRLLAATGGYGRTQVMAHSSLTWIAELEERYPDMLTHAERALELSWAAGDRSMEIMSLGDVGRLGQPRLRVPQAQRLPALGHLLRTVPRPGPGGRRPVQPGGHPGPPRRRPLQRGRPGRGSLGLEPVAAPVRRARPPRRRPHPRQAPPIRPPPPGNRLTRPPPGTVLTSRGLTSVG